MYIVADLIQKCISIEQLAYKLYSDFSNNKALDNRTKLTAKVLAAEELRHVSIFTELKDKFSKDSSEINLEVFDKASKLMQEFKSRLNSLNANNSKELVKYAIDLEDANIALLIAIKDELVKITKGNDAVTYKVLEELINQEKNHAQNLLPFSK